MFEEKSGLKEGITADFVQVHICEIFTSFTLKNHGFNLAKDLK